MQLLRSAHRTSLFPACSHDFSVRSGRRYWHRAGSLAQIHRFVRFLLRKLDIGTELSTKETQRQIAQPFRSVGRFFQITSGMRRQLHLVGIVCGPLLVAGFAWSYPSKPGAERGISIQSAGGCEARSPGVRQPKSKALVKCRILNRMVALGLPASVCIQVL